MKIEILFPELYSYGEQENIAYLQKMLHRATFILTAFDQVPTFVNEPVDMIIMQSMAEPFLSQVTEKLMPYRARLEELIDVGVYFFITDNAMEVFGQQLLVDGIEQPTLKLLDYQSNRKMRRRTCRLFLGDYQGIKICGVENGFTTYEIDEKYRLYQSKFAHLKGFHYKNVVALEFIDHFFINNPPISKKVMQYFGYEEALPLEDLVMKAYQKRVSIYQEK